MSRFDSLWHAEADDPNRTPPNLRTHVGRDGIIRDILDVKPTPAAQPFERRRLRVYIAGPISKGDPFLNVMRGLQWGRTMLADGLAPYIPHLDAYLTLQPGTPPTDQPSAWNALLEWDLEWVAQSEALFRIEGESKGADLEARVATDLGIPVFSEDAYRELLDYADDRVLRGVRSYA